MGPGQDNARALARGYAAFARGDIAGLLTILDPEIEWTVPEGAPIEYRGVFRGHDAVAGGVLGKIPVVWAAFSVRPERFIEDGDHVVVLGTYGVVPKRGSRESEIPFAHVWEMRDGKALRFRDHSDTGLARDLRADGGAQ